MERQMEVKTQYKNAKKDFLIGGLLFLVFALFFVGSLRIKIVASDGIVTARFFPMLISGIGMALAIALALTNAYRFWTLKSEIDDAAAIETESQQNAPAYRWKMVIFSILLMGIYVFLFNYLGFILASALYLFIQIFVLEQNRSLKQILIIAAVSIGIPLIIYFPFRYIFYLIFPQGIFGF